MTCSGTVAQVFLRRLKCLNGFIIVLIYCEVYFLYVITCCVEIVTPFAVFINHLLSTAMAMWSNKWKASYDSNRKYRSK